MNNGKGSDRRPEARKGAYADGWGAIWGEVHETRRFRVGRACGALRPRDVRCRDEGHCSCSNNDRGACCFCGVDS